MLAFRDRLRLELVHLPSGRRARWPSHGHPLIHVVPDVRGRPLLAFGDGTVVRPDLSPLVDPPGSFTADVRARTGFVEEGGEVWFRP